MANFEPNVFLQKRSDVLRSKTKDEQKLFTKGKRSLPLEIFDQIIIQLNDFNLAIKLKRFYAVIQIFKIREVTCNILDWSIRYGNSDLVNYLISKGYQLPITDHSFIYLASSYGNLEILKYFHSKREKYYINDLTIACTNKHLNIVKYFIEMNLFRNEISWIKHLTMNAVKVGINIGLDYGSKDTQKKHYQIALCLQNYLDIIDPQPEKYKNYSMKPFLISRINGLFH
jgi:hypothetical protein